MGLKTTTWKARNLNKLDELKNEICKRKLNKPVIMDIGPGGVIKFLSRYFPYGDKHEWNKSTKFKKFFLHLFESSLRKTGLFKLKSYEIEEIIEIFKNFDYSKIYVLDNQEKVLEGVVLNSNRKIIPLNFDISSERIPYKADIIICYNVIQRTCSPKSSLENIVNSLNKNGLLSIDLGNERLNPGEYGLKKISNYLYAN